MVWRVTTDRFDFTRSERARTGLRSGAHLLAESTDMVKASCDRTAAENLLLSFIWIESTLANGLLPLCNRHDMYMGYMSVIASRRTPTHTIIFSINSRNSNVTIYMKTGLSVTVRLMTLTDNERTGPVDCYTTSWTNGRSITMSENLPANKNVFTML